MLIRLLCAHEMNKHVRKISRLNSKRSLRKLQKIRGLLYFAAPCSPVHVHDSKRTYRRTPAGSKDRAIGIASRGKTGDTEHTALLNSRLYPHEGASGSTLVTPASVLIIIIKCTDYSDIVAENCCKGTFLFYIHRETIYT